MFNKEAADVDMDAWMSAFKHAGASYAILTAKHHDGFCLWPNERLEWEAPHNNSSTTDFILRFKHACEKWGLRFGTYYSWSEFGTPVTPAYMKETVLPQIADLVQYKPDIFWFDGDWECRTKDAIAVVDRCVTNIRRLLPYCEVNDRVGHKEERRDAGFLGRSTFRVYADRAIPETAPTVPWEHVNTIGLSWGRNLQQKPSDYKSARELLALYRKVTGLGGRFCLNVGPSASGRICDDELSRLRQFGGLLSQQ